jgi:hypothetical protein
MENMYLPKPHFSSHARKHHQDVIQRPICAATGAAANETAGLIINGNEMKLTVADQHRRNHERSGGHCEQGPDDGLDAADLVRWDWWICRRLT